MNRIFLRLLLCVPLYAGAQKAAHYDVLIHEFLADPDPSVGLPPSSFIELRNVSRYTFNLHNWKIGTASTAATIKQDLLLDPDSLIILCPASAGADYRVLGTAHGLSGFPSLNHDAGQIILLAEDGSVIHAIQYDKTWYHNELKSSGGWSLEMIDPKNPCSGSSNWTASTASDGGTPGAYNSVAGENPDRQMPDLVRSITVDSLHVIALFSEPMDSSRASDVLNYSFDPGEGNPLQAAPVAPFYDQVALTLNSPMEKGQVYTLMVHQLTDCSTNELGVYNHCLTGLPETPAAGDIIFNEILFNPPPYGADYVEIYNRSRKVIDMPDIFLAGRDAMGAIKDPHAFQASPQLLFPGEYAVVTEDTAWVLKNYNVPYPEKLFRLSSLPSMPDDQGSIVLLDKGGQVLDELSYDHHWHSPLLADEEGVSLERMRFNDPTNRADNWASATSDCGFGTPTSKNSETASDLAGSGEISADPKVFSPDNDGYVDFCFLKYHLPDPGYSANISIYDISGRAVRVLANNSTIGTDGQFRWDGTDEGLNPLPTGHYIIDVRLFNLLGKIKKYKLVVTLARKY